MATRRGRPIKINPKYGAATDVPVSAVQENAGSSMETAQQVCRQIPVSAVQENARTEVAPTIQIQFQNAKQTIEVQKQKILHLEDKVNSLTEERNYLRARHEDSLIQKGPSEGVPTQTATTRKSSTSESSNFSTSESSDSEPPKHKKRKVKEKHRAKRHKKSKKLTSDYSKRVHTPEESLKRYYKVLNLVKQGLSKAEAYNRLNVDRNTIVIQAPIAELAAANPESFRKLRQMFKKGDSILKFAESCLCLCKEKANEDVIKQMKEANDLLDINKK
ncbi:coiled-coil domain-containing protein 106-like isoform X1 [Carassius auratus]|uniref:Coiled-coil domain-containing protein 106-like isoform X1 n=1 Tax=Carassius auratus TaxID=7957 RepID=A0A6P6PCK6_CARAU|nr:coiled-coil domain-containing protein 106-like isoform X1 [Carassius auratus]